MRPSAVRCTSLNRTEKKKKGDARILLNITSTRHFKKKACSTNKVAQTKKNFTQSRCTALEKKTRRAKKRHISCQHLTESSTIVKRKFNVNKKLWNWKRSRNLHKNFLKKHFSIRLTHSSKEGIDSCKSHDISFRFLPATRDSLKKKEKEGNTTQPQCKKVRLNTCHSGNNTPTPSLVPFA